MRSYRQLYSFMCDLGDGIQDHLPEEVRTEQLSVEGVVILWVDKKSYLAIRSLKKDMMAYLKKCDEMDYSLDAIFPYDDNLLFVLERFGYEESVLFSQVLPMIQQREAETHRSLLADLVKWFRSL
ncbi:hypothetical protein BWR59_11245 [Pseudomonas sp. Bc-h]|jgi:hypothetical protein|uniref:hypothetical protein n=1 Tax=Pseudomonas sp. Bc-h TaxID=1943632 RepID=UPI0009D9B1A1|nr:hypothetical protein [Pseudomonas sp. Bc-h]OQR32536.1 hypothetical protein BWR59_11245 [Pseudomonas sp. Bc-h]